MAPSPSPDPATSWDPALYLRFADERARPWHDLLARIPTDPAPRTIVDLGCGPGQLTATLTQRWPDATVTGVDSSAEMIAEAQALSVPGRLDFVRQSIEQWRPAEPVNLIVSNAALQWVPSHSDLIRHWLDTALAPGGALAVQLPAGRSLAAEAFRTVATRPHWVDRLGPIAESAIPGGAGSPVREPVGYADLLARAGYPFDVWETTYLHLLAGEDPVLNWYASTGLRPYLEELGGAAKGEFRAELAEVLRQAFPRRDYGTLLPFRRIFIVARRPG